MAYLGRGRKEELQCIAVDLGVANPEDMNVVQLKKAITESTDYDESLVKEMLQTRIEDRRRKEEIEDRKRKEERDRQERKDREEREFELEKLKLQYLDKSSESASTVSKTELRHLMQKFDEKESDISLYLLLFERQAEWAQIKREDYVSHLLGLLPGDITQIIAREPAEKMKEYDFVKNLLIKRFKLSPEKFRQKYCYYC